MVTTTFLLDEEDFEAAETLFQYSRARGNFSEEIRTPEEEREAEHEAALALIELSKTHPKQHNNKKMKKADKTQPEEVKIAGQAVAKQPRKIREDDDSDETLGFLVQWNVNKPEKPPFVRELDVVGVCSKPTRKQLTESDVKGSQCRLMLGKKQVKKMMLHVMGNSQGVIGTDGLEVSVYGPGGEVRKMMFKMWSGDTPVLKSREWNKLVKAYGLKMHCDFLTIWMFRHRETRQICFALHFTRFPLVDKPLSKRIINTVRLRDV